MRSYVIYLFTTYIIEQRQSERGLTSDPPRPHAPFADQPEGTQSSHTAMPALPIKRATWNSSAMQLRARCQLRAVQVAAGLRQSMARLLLLGLPSY